MVLDRIFGSTVEFLLHKVNGDPVALLQTIADYTHRNRPVSQRLTCSKECLLRAAAEANLGQAKHHCSKCEELQKVSRDWSLGAIRSSVEPSPLDASLGIHSSFEFSALDSRSLKAQSHQQLHDGGFDQSGDPADGIQSLGLEDFSFQVEHVNQPGGSGSSPLLESNRMESQPQHVEVKSGTDERASNRARVSFGFLKSQDAVSSQQVLEDAPAAGPSSSFPLVPNLALKEMPTAQTSAEADMKRGGSVSVGERMVQSARGAHSGTSSGRQNPDSPRGSKKGNLSERERPHTSSNGEDRGAGCGVEESESSNSSPRKDKGVKELMTPDDHIKAWLAEKKRKEVRRERHVRRRQLAELEFIAALRRTQARRLRHLHEEEGKFDIATSEAEVLFEKESAEARCRSLKGTAQRR